MKRILELPDSNLSWVPTILSEDHNFPQSPDFFKYSYKQISINKTTLPQL